jgi:hypothetical protein
MNVSLRHTYRALLDAIGVGTIGVTVLCAAVSPTVSTAPEDCTANELARTVSSVINNVANYLDANPGEKSDLEAIRQPLKEMTQRCGQRGQTRVKCPRRPISPQTSSVRDTATMSPSTETPTK